MRIFRGRMEEIEHLATIKNQEDIDKLGMYGVISKAEEKSYNSLYFIQIKIGRSYKKENTKIRAVTLYRTSYNADHPTSNCQTATLSNVNALFSSGVGVTAALLECIAFLPTYQAKNQLLFDVSLVYHTNIMERFKESDIEVIFETEYVNKTGISMVMVLLDIFPDTVVSESGDSLDEYHELCEEQDLGKYDEYKHEEMAELKYAYESVYKRRG